MVSEKDSGVEFQVYGTKNCIPVSSPPEWDFWYRRLYFQRMLPRLKCKISSDR